MRRGAAAALAALLSLPACGAQQPRDMSIDEVARELRRMAVEPGLWEVSSEVLDANGPNLPREAQARMKGHRTTTRNCITPAQAAHPEANFLRRQRSSHCRYRGFSTEGGRIVGEMICTGGGQPGTMTTNMDGRHSPRSHDVHMRMASTEMPEGANMTIETRTRSRRIGDCPPTAPPPATGGTQ